MSDFRANIKAVLDLTVVAKQIKEIEKSNVVFKNITLDTQGLYTKIQSSLNSHSFKINVSGISTNNISNEMKSSGVIAGNNYSQSLIKTINSKISNGSLDAAISSVTRKFNLLSSNVSNINSGAINSDLTKRLKQVENDLITLNSLKEQFNNSGMSAEALVSSYNRFNSTLSGIKNNLTVVSNNSRQFASTIEVITLQNKMESWLNKNTKATKKYGTEVNNYIQILKGMASQGDVSKAALTEISNGFKAIDHSAELAGLKGKSLTITFKNALQSISKYVSASTLIYSAFGAFKNGVKNIIELDSALVDLKKTTDATSTQLENFYYDSNDVAKNLGVTTKEVIQATSEWSRLGYSIEDAKTMAENSSIFASISPGMDISSATDGLISAMKAFDIEANDSLDGIVSKINAIGNTQAVDNQDIVNVLTRSSSAMKEANNTLEETIALGTAATEITRDAESVGNALKTISMRIRGYDEETEEYVGGVETLAGDIADLTKTVSNPSGISLFTDEEKTQFKSTTQLLRDISVIYDELTDKQQANLLEKLAGKRQGQVIAAILNNFETVDESLATMANSAGGAIEEMSIVEQSLEFKLNSLKETTVGIFQNIFQQEDTARIIEFLTKLLEAIDFIIEKAGILNTLAIGTGFAAIIKNLD